MSDIIVAIFSGLVVLLGAFLFRKKIFPEQGITPRPLPKAPEPKLDNEKKKEIRNDLKKISNHNLAKLLLSKLRSSSSSKHRKD